MKTRVLLSALMAMAGLLASHLRVVAETDEQLSDTDKKLRRTVEFGNILDLSLDPLSLSETDKAEMRTTIRAYCNKWVKDDGLLRMYEEALIRLGDIDLAKTYINERMDADPIGVGDCLIRSGNPDVILLLGPILFRNEPYRVAPGDVPVSDPSHEVALGIIPQLLSNSRAFNANVTNWIRDFWRPDKNPVFYSDPDAAREMIREWWKQNEARFRARDFKNVTPGRLSPPKKGTDPAVEAPKEPAKPPASLQIGTPQPATIPSVERESHPSPWMIFAAIATCLAVLAFALRGRILRKP